MKGGIGNIRLDKYFERDERVYPVVAIKTSLQRIDSLATDTTKPTYAVPDNGLIGFTGIFPKTFAPAFIAS